MRRNRNTSVNYLEFKGGYARIPRGWIACVIEAYRSRELVKADLRVFAAMIEHGVLHPDSPVDLYRVVNAEAKRKGVRRLPRAEIEERVSRVACVTDRDVTGEDRLVRVSRKMARAIARGLCGATEAVVLFFYCFRRIRQRKPMQRLEPDERYARFRYAELSELSGAPRANISRAVCRLRERGLVSTAEVAKQNENALGQVFVDGSLVSLIAPRRLSRAARSKTTTLSGSFDTTPHQESTTLRNKDPKKRIMNGSLDLASRIKCAGGDWDRIQERARQMRAAQQGQAA